MSPIASYFDKDFVKEKESRADAIVDNVAHRRDKVLEIIKDTNGAGFVISNDELVNMRNIFYATRETTNSTGQSQTGLDRSRAELGWQSALSLSGFMKWRAQNLKKSKQQISVCLFTD